MSHPSTAICPQNSGNKPRIKSMSVVFPDPERPIKATVWPRWITRLMSFKRKCGFAG